MQSIELMANDIVTAPEPSELEIIMKQIHALGEQVTALDAAIGLYAQSVTAPTKPEPDTLNDTE